MKIHHVGYLVMSIQNAREDFQKLGLKISSPQTFDEERKIFIQFMADEKILVELIEPAQGCTLFPKRLKNLGSTPYHICYECDNLEKKIDELREKNFILIREPQIAPALENRRVAFLYSEAVGQIELLESE